ncbi:MAG: putative flavoprotein involved in transport [Microbacteriaceae bacterium]|nr:putative flavoprotein involved in transport [Microbacteriaceae bacterium]
MTLLSENTTDTMDSSPEAAAARWVTEFERALGAGDHAGLSALFAANAVWRDQVVFSWDVRNWEGAGEVASAFLGYASRKAHNFRIKAGTVPQQTGEGAAASISALFDFETVLGVGSAVTQLVPADTAVGWVAPFFMTQLDALKDYPWRIDGQRPVGRGHGGLVDRADPAVEWAKALAFEDREPEVVVLGAGHNGLMIGAQLERLGVDTLLLERTPRVGDVWRNRYAALALHNQTEVNDFPHMPFPRSFPRYIPKDTLADFMEYYAKAMELKVWNSTGIDSAVYDDAAKRWDITITREDGSTRVLHPAHFIIATGLNGNPRIPEFEGIESYTGTYSHSGVFEGGEKWRGKKVLVVGAGVSAHDISQDLYEHGSDVTLLQRSSTYIVDVDTFHKYFYADYMVPDMKLEIADITSSMIPLGTMRERGMLNYVTGLMAADDKQLLADLEARGFAFDFRPNGNGVAEGHYSGHDSYYFDIGASRLIADGKLNFKSGSGIERFTPTGVVLTDGTEIEADHVVLATGYTSMLDAYRPIIGDEIADRVGSVWRWGDDKEITSVYRPVDQAGLWFMTGTIRDSRVNSGFLAMQIKARQEGLVDAEQEGLIS